MIQFLKVDYIKHFKFAGFKCFCQVEWETDFSYRVYFVLTPTFSEQSWQNESFNVVAWCMRDETLGTNEGQWISLVGSFYYRKHTINWHWPGLLSVSLSHWGITSKLQMRQFTIYCLIITFISSKLQLFWSLNISTYLPSLTKYVMILTKFEICNVISEIC